MNKKQVACINSDNLCQAAEQTLARAADTALNPVFIIVPDRFTLQAERIILGKKSCVFNTRVVTFSMLFNILHEECKNRQSESGNIKNNVLDKTSAVLFMWRAIAKVKTDLVWFGRSAGHYAFAERMFNTMNQLSSSMVDFEKLPANAKSDITRKKMHDIVLIRNAYKKLIEDSTDSSGVLGWLIENIRHSDIIKNSKIFVTGFQHFSVQRCAVITELIKTASEFTAGYQSGSEFEQLMAEVVLNTNALCKHITAESDSSPVQPEVRAFDTVQDEAIWVTNEICRLVKTEGVRFRDIAVVAADYDNAAPVFGQTFAENGITVNLDIGADLLNHPLTKYVMEYLLLAATGSQRHFINIIKSLYSGLDTFEEFELENKALKSGMRGNHKTAGFVSDLCKCKTVQEFADCVTKIIESTESIDDDIARRKILELTATIIKISAAQKISITDFINMFEALSASTKVSDIPSFSDAVLLVSASEYQPCFVPYVFVTGAADGRFPALQEDTDIITAQDIANTAEHIEPSASLQNARNRRHAADILASASIKLYVSFTGCNPSELVQKTETENSEVPAASKTFAVHTVLKAIGDGTAFEDMQYYGGILKSLDLGGIQYFNPNRNIGDLTKPEKLFFPSGTLSVTQLDNFRKCPFYHFLENGLRIRVRERNIIAANIVGTIIHKIAELFTLKIIKLGSKQNLKTFDWYTEMDKTVSAVLGFEEFKFFAADAKNMPVISNLKKEAKILARELVREISESDYFPAAAEMCLSGKIEGVTVRGKADRIDLTCGNHARIIDYKTGTVDKQSLQLPLYLRFMPEEYTADEAYYFALRPGSLKSYKASDSADVLKLAHEIIGKIKNGVIQPEPADKKTCRYCPARLQCQGGANEED